jgi:hypothetical protein
MRAAWEALGWAYIFQHRGGGRRLLHTACRAEDAIQHSVPATQDHMVRTGLEELQHLHVICLQQMASCAFQRWVLGHSSKPRPTIIGSLKVVALCCFDKGGLALMRWHRDVKSASPLQGTNLHSGHGAPG